MKEAVDIAIQIARKMSVENKSLEEAVEDIVGEDIHKSDDDIIDDLEQQTPLTWDVCCNADKSIRKFISTRRDGRIQVLYIEIAGEQPKLVYGTSLMSTSVTVESSIEQAFDDLLDSVMLEVQQELSRHISEVVDDVSTLKKEAS